MKLDNLTRITTIIYVFSSRNQKLKKLIRDKLKSSLL